MTVADCPCGGGPYAACCEPAHAQTAWPATAEALMRSRYSAFALGLADYLWASWHPRTRPSAVTLDETVWTGLTVTEVVDGEEWASEGVVAFEASWRRGRTHGVLTERSAFAKRGGRWFYLEALDGSTPSG